MSNIDSINFIQTSNIKVVTQIVTEKINQKFLKSFVTSTLESNNIIIDDDTSVYPQFIKETSSYEIYIINTSDINIEITPNILSAYYIKETNNIDLFITEKFFTIYKHGKLYLFKQFKESSHEDIKNYIIQTYKLSLDNIYFIDELKYKQLQKLYIKNINSYTKPKFISLKMDRSFLLFSTFSVICIAIFILSLNHLFYDTSNNNIKRLDRLKLKYENIQSNKINYKKLTPKMVELFRYIKIQQLTTTKITYNKNSIELSLLHKRRDKLLNFLTSYGKKITVENIQFLEDKNLYQMVVKVAV